jgi:NitT/TauT family transport system ATP-binding protein
VTTVWRAELVERGREAEVAPPSTEAFVSIQDVELAYGRGGRVLALDHLNLDVSEGEFAAVVGPSGCGKSSLMKLVTGLLFPTNGAIEVAGNDVDGPLKIVGMAFQNPTLLPWRDVLSNVMLPFEIVDRHRYKVRLDREKYESVARSLLQSVGLGGFERRYPWQLSGGMQQRASLCRALVHEPALLMLDEPFGALDAFTREELWDVLQGLWMARKFTTILVTHDLREAVYLADKVHVMSQRPGRIVATHAVSIGRPRNPDTMFAPEFLDIVHSLRERIRAESTKPHLDHLADTP